MLVLFVMAVIMLVVDETKRRNSRPEDEIVEENPEGSQTAEYYTYADVMNDVKYLAETEEQRQAIESRHRVHGNNTVYHCPAFLDKFNGTLQLLS